MLLPLLLSAVLPSLPLGPQATEDEARPPLGLHLRDLDGLETASGLVVDDEGGAWVLEEGPGRLVRIEPDGARRVVAQGLVRPRDLEVAPDGSYWITEPHGRGLVHLGTDGAPLGVVGADVLVQAYGLELAGETLYVTDVATHRVERFTTGGEPLAGFGGYGLGPGQLLRPVDVAVDAAGEIYVAEAGTSRVQVFDADGNSLRKWGDWGPFLGLFTEPSGIEVRGDEVYVADHGNHRVQVFALGGKRLDRFGLHAIRPREGGGYLHYPAALALSPNGEFAGLSEPTVDRVQLFCRTGGTAEDAVRMRATQLAKPASHYGTELASAGPWLVIGEPESHSVLVFEDTADDPRRITRVSGLGSKTGLLTGVAGLHLDRARRRLFICDPLLRRVSVFELDVTEEDEVGFDARMARFVKSVDLARLVELQPQAALKGVPEPVAITRDAAGRVYLCDRRNACVLVLSAELALLEAFGAGELTDPTGIVVAADGSVLVADGRGRVVRFEPEGREAATFAELPAPHGLALAADGTLFVTDSSTHSVSAFDAEGRLLRRWGSAGLGRQQMYKPRGISIDLAGNVVVLDHANHRLMRFTPEGRYVSTFGLRLYTRPARLPDLQEEEE